MIAENQHEVTINSINEKLNLIISKSEDNITISINYKDVVFSDIIDIKEDNLVYAINANKGRDVKVDNIYDFICYSLKNNNTCVNFTIDDKIGYVLFNITFDIKMCNTLFRYRIYLDGDYEYDEFIKSIKSSCTICRF